MEKDKTQIPKRITRGNSTVEPGSWGTLTVSTGGRHNFPHSVFFLQFTQETHSCSLRKNPAWQVHMVFCFSWQEICTVPLRQRLQLLHWKRVSLQ